MFFSSVTCISSAQRHPSPPKHPLFVVTLRCAHGSHWKLLQSLLARRSTFIFPSWRAGSASFIRYNNRVKLVLKRFLSLSLLLSPVFCCKLRSFPFLQSIRSFHSLRLCWTIEPRSLQQPRPAYCRALAAARPFEQTIFKLQVIPRCQSPQHAFLGNHQTRNPVLRFWRSRRSVPANGNCPVGSGRALVSPTPRERGDRRGPWYDNGLHDHNRHYHYYDLLKPAAVGRWYHHRRPQRVDLCCACREP